MHKPLHVWKHSKQMRARSKQHLARSLDSWNLPGAPITYIEFIEGIPNQLPHYKNRGMSAITSQPLCLPMSTRTCRTAKGVTKSYNRYILTKAIVSKDPWWRTLNWEPFIQVSCDPTIQLRMKSPAITSTSARFSQREITNTQNCKTRKTNFCNTAIPRLLVAIADDP